MVTQSPEVTANLEYLAGLEKPCHTCGGEKWVYLGHPLERKCDPCKGTGVVARIDWPRVENWCACYCHQYKATPQPCEYDCEDAPKHGGWRVATLAEVRLEDVLDSLDHPHMFQGKDDIWHVYLVDNKGIQGGGGTLPEAAIAAVVAMEKGEQG